MRKSVLKFINIPTQMESESEAQAVESAAEVVRGSITSAFGSNFIISLLTAAAMDQIWSVVNSL